MSAPISRPWAAVDNLVRTKIGAETWDASDIPAPLVTVENASEFLDASYPFVDFEQTFASHWR
ncbi:MULTISPECIES: hypothetical protein [unclassified Pseudofrankia]|uniref:hypothetical protein n=1 Tax=unclassified Pseudofrankia TaxID=2994372 RepID=UPI0008D9DA33|nr:MULTISPECIES: hypothetical protein [unclassified Pseudofrankia]MDT3444706.1 hypothetical protein [Pseudofrankia sp. BMG5.37]OHV66558.1 hypothetical protein BCD48_35735 [Pseudofrankia sp. BMG5.36]